MNQELRASMQLPVKPYSSGKLGNWASCDNANLWCLCFLHLCVKQQEERAAAQ